MLVVHASTLNKTYLYLFIVPKGHLERYINLT